MKQKASPLSTFGKRPLFVFAHPDDECFASIALGKLLRKKRDVHCVWATSGQARGGMDVREKELHASLNLLGASQEKAVLLRLPNRGLLPLLDSGAAKLGEIIAQHKADTVVVPAYEGGHIDHDAVNFMAWHALTHHLDRTPQPKLLEFPLYNRTGNLFTLFWRINDFPKDTDSGFRISPDAEDIRTKHAMMAAYKSQKRDMIPFRRALSASRLRLKGEPYRPFPTDRDYLKPPHPGRLNYEGLLLSPRLADFSDFAAAVSACIQPE